MPSEQISSFLFNIEDDIELREEEVTIEWLRKKFEELGLKNKKLTLLARYLIETPSSGEYIYNEKTKANAYDIVTKCQKLIGQYHLYSSDGTAYDDNPNFV